MAPRAEVPAFGAGSFAAFAGAGLPLAGAGFFGAGGFAPDFGLATDALVFVTGFCVFRALTFFFAGFEDGLGEFAFLPLLTS